MREPLDPATLAWWSWLKRCLLLHRSLLLNRAELGPGDADAAATYLGEGETLAYLAGLHGGLGRRRRVPLTAVRRELRRLAGGGGLLYLELNRLLPRPSRASFRSAPWVRQRIDLDGEAFRSHRPDVEGVFGRKVRHHGLSYRIALDADAVNTFFDEHYLPHVAARHAGALHLRRRGELHRAVRRGFLLEVVDAAEWVAGAICQRHRDGLTVLAYGLRGNQAAGRARGWLSAATYFAIDIARNEGLSFVDLLRSRPHAADGVYEHKRRFGATARFDPWPHTTLWVLPPEATPLPAPAAGVLVSAAGELVPLEQAMAGRREA